MQPNNIQNDKMKLKYNKTAIQIVNKGNIRNDTNNERKS